MVIKTAAIPSPFRSKKETNDVGLPISHWSHSSLLAFLRNPLAWYKRYVEKVYDMPSGPAAWIGKAGHKALEHYYGGIDKAGAIDLGLEYLQSAADFEINFGKTGKTKRAAKKNGSGIFASDQLLLGEAAKVQCTRHRGASDSAGSGLAAATQSRIRSRRRIARRKGSARCGRSQIRRHV